MGNPWDGLRRLLNRPLPAPAARLTLIGEQGSIGRCPRVVTDERR
jgi:hypothetical protein